MAINLVIAGSYEITIMNLGTFQGVEKDIEQGILYGLQTGDYVLNMTAKTIDNIKDLKPVYSFIVSNTENVEYEFEEIEGEERVFVVNVTEIEWETDGEERVFVVNVTEIEWETDGEEIDLPTSLTIEIPNTIDSSDGMDVGDYVSEEISNIVGWCHKGFKTDKDDFLEFS